MNFSSGALGSGNGDGMMSEEEEMEQEEMEEEEEEEVEQPSGNSRTLRGSVSALAQHSQPAVMAQTQSSALPDWASSSEGETVLICCLFICVTLGLTCCCFSQLDFAGHEEALSPALAQLEDRTADSDVSDR